MNYDVMVKDSLEYAKEALIGKWGRWITFIILALPFALMQFIFDPEKLMNKTTGAFNWELIPWGQLAVLFIIGTLFGFFIAGYIVRVFRGVKPAPDFDEWAGLFIDGLKLNIVWFLWFLPSLVLLIASIGMMVISLGNAKDPDGSMILIFLVCMLLLVVAGILAIIASLYSYLGSVRFARTGSIREGIRFSKVTEMIRGMGWVPYIIALLVLCVISFIFGIITMVLSVIPFAGWVLVLIINPFFTLIAARYAVLVYDQGENPSVVEVQN